MRNFLNRISRGGNCVCVSIHLSYFGSVRLCFGKLPQDPKRLHFTEDSFEQNLVVRRFAQLGPSVQASSTCTQSRKKRYRWSWTSLWKVASRQLDKTKMRNKCIMPAEQQTNSSAISSTKNDGLTPFPSHVSMLWNLCRDPTPLGSPCPTKTKVWTMWWTNRPGFDIVCHCKSSHAQESGLLHSSHLGIARVTCAMLYLYYMIVVELSLWTDFCLFDQRNTSAAHQLTSDLNKHQTPISFSSRKWVTEERISMKYINVIWSSNLPK